jgi:alpha-L-fucosidase
VFDKPVNHLVVKGLRNEKLKITLLSTGEELSATRVGGVPWERVPGVLFITLPKDLDVGYGTVVKIEMEKPIDLYITRPKQRRTGK